MSAKIQRGLIAPPPDHTVLHIRECQNVACRVDTYLAMYGHVAMMSCPACPNSGIQMTDVKVPK